MGILTFVFAKSLDKCKEAPKSNGYIYRVVGCVSEGRRFQSHLGLDWTTLTVHPAMNGYLAFFWESLRHQKPGCSIGISGMMLVTYTWSLDQAVSQQSPEGALTMKKYAKCKLCYPTSYFLFEPRCEKTSFFTLQKMCCGFLLSREMWYRKSVLPGTGAG